MTGASETGTEVGSKGGPWIAMLVMANGFLKILSPGSYPQI